MTAAAPAWAIAGRFGRFVPSILVWDGAAWSAALAESGAAQGRVVPMIDLGAWLLVRFDADPRVQPLGIDTLWLPLRERDNRSAWPALRTALYAPADPPVINRVPRFTRPHA